MGISCKPKMPKVEQTPIYAQQLDARLCRRAASANRRVTDKSGAAQSTILTSASGRGFVCFNGRHYPCR